MSKLVKWYPVSPVIWNETRGRRQEALYKSCLTDRDESLRPYDPYGAVDNMPTRPGGEAKSRRKNALSKYNKGDIPEPPAKLCKSGIWRRWTDEIDA